MTKVIITKKLTIDLIVTTITMIIMTITIILILIVQTKMIIKK